MENDELKESDISLNKLNKNNFNCHEARTFESLNKEQYDSQEKLLLMPHDSRAVK